MVLLKVTAMDVVPWLGIAAAIVVVLACVIVLASRLMPSNGPDVFKQLTTFWAVIVGIIVLVTMFFVILPYVDDADDQFNNALGVASLILAPLGTFIGFVAGQSAASSGQAQAVDAAQKSGEAAAETARAIAREAQQNLQQAHKRNEALVSVIPQEQYQDLVKNRYPELFQN